MRKSYSFILIISLLFLTTTAFSQYTFRVLANKGANQVKKAGASAVALKTGETLNANDELIVATGGYIGLMHKTGKTIEVKTPGSQKVSVIEQKLAAKKTSYTSKYAAYIANKMNEGTRTRASRMNATGAVSRAVMGAGIAVLVPELSNEVLGEHAIIRWETPEGQTEEAMYNVRVQNIFDEVLFEDELTGNSFDLNFQEVPNETNLYRVFISLKDNKDVVSAPIGIKRVERDNMEELLESYEGLKNEVSDDTPLNKMIFASFFEENGLLVDALTMYEEAIAMSPEIDGFKELYYDFQVVNGIKSLDEEETEE